MVTYIIITPLIAGNSGTDNQQPSLINNKEGSTTIYVVVKRLRNGGHPKDEDIV